MYLVIVISHELQRSISDSGARLMTDFVSFQDFLFATLGELMNRHVFYDKKSIAGQAVVELGRAETYLIRCSRAQAGKSVVERLL